MDCSKPSVVIETRDAPACTFEYVFQLLLVAGKVVHLVSPILSLESAYAWHVGWAMELTFGRPHSPKRDHTGQQSLRCEFPRGRQTVRFKVQLQPV